MDWLNYNNRASHEAARNHSREEHQRAHAADIAKAFALAETRFDRAFEEFITFHDQATEEDRANFIHLFLADLSHKLGELAQASRENEADERVFDEMAAVYAAAGWGFILGRTMQELDTQRLAAHGLLNIASVELA